VDITSTTETVATKTLPIIVAVGADGGRGFVVQVGSDRYVLTAAHCLPDLPPASSASMLDERTYANLLGPLGEEQTVWAECVFVDPVADIAVLCSPDGQSLFEEADAYEALVENEDLPAWTVDAPPLVEPPADWPTRVPADRAIGKSPARLVSLDCRLFDCTIVHSGRGHSLWVEDAAEPIRGGMSGSPILDNHGRAIGMVCTAGGIVTEDGRTIGEVNGGGPNPKLVDVLPAWLVRRLIEKPGIAEDGETRWREAGAQWARSLGYVQLEGLQLDLADTDIGLNYLAERITPLISEDQIIAMRLPPEWRDSEDMMLAFVAGAATVWEERENSDEAAQ
jgi:hypothetical protein